MSIATPEKRTRSAVGVFTPEAFEASLAKLARPPAWWVERKRAAYARFAELPLPARKDESWRFSTVGDITLEGYGPENRQIVSPAKFAAGNRPVPSPSLYKELAKKGVTVTPLEEAVVSHSDLLKEHFMAQAQRLGSEKFAALHTAFVTGGTFIHIPRGVEVTEPIITHYSSIGGVIFPHTLVVADEGAKATVIDLFSSEGDAPQFACGANDLYAGHGARLTYLAVQDWSRSTLSFQLNSTVVRRDARVQSLNLHLGGRQARNESLSQLQAPGAFSEMLALTAASGEQEFDQRTLQIHQAPDTKSDLLYKNALLDGSKTVFSGLIIVDPDAQRTDAYQSNRNLVLSDDAEANSLPGLEIQANDVRCTHGATTSRIDAEQEFYLKSRGLTPAAARELLIGGFFEEVLNRLEDESIHAELRPLIETKVAEAAAKL